jgi:coproporphyrinogen III oxidase
LQCAPQITGCVQHTDDFNPVIQRPIKDDIPTEGRAAQPWHKRVANPAHKRVCGEEFAMLLQPLDELRGVGGIVARYKIADVDEITFGTLREA